MFLSQLLILGKMRLIDFEQRYAAKYISLKGKGKKGRVSSYTEADPSKVSQWILTGAGF